MMDTLLNLFLFVLITFALYLNGAALARFLPRDATPAERFLYTLAGGALVLIFIMALLGILNRLSLQWVAILDLLFLIRGSRRIWNELRTLPSLLSALPKAFRWRPSGVFQWFLLFFVAIQTLILFIKVMTPTLHYDALNQYLRQIIQMVALQSVQTADPWCSGMPANIYLFGALGRMVSAAAGLSVYDTTLIRLLICFLPLLVAFALMILMARREWGIKLPLLPMAIFLSIESTLFMSQTGKPYLGAYMFEFLFLYGVYRWLKGERQETRWLWCSGLFLGAALGSGWSTYLNGPALFICFISLWNLYPNKRQWLMDGCRLAFPILLIGFVWEIYHHFVPPLGLRSAFEYVSHYDVVMRFYSGITGFFQMIWEYSGRKEVIPSRGQNLGPLLILFMPLLVVYFLQTRDRVARFLLLYAGIYYVGHYFFKQSVRDVTLALSVFALFSYPVLTELIGNKFRPEIRGLFCAVFVFLSMGTLMRQVQNVAWAGNARALIQGTSSKEYYDRIAPTLFDAIPDIPVENYLKSRAPAKAVLILPTYFDLFLEHVPRLQVGEVDWKTLKLPVSGYLVLVRRANDPPGGPFAGVPGVAKKLVVAGHLNNIYEFEGNGFFVQKNGQIVLEAI